MTHTHGMDPIRREAEREAAARIYEATTALLEHGDKLQEIKASHVSSFPCGALTCEQTERLAIGLSHIERARLSLRDLLTDLPNKT